MMWWQQKAKVERISKRATQHKAHLADVRSSMRGWKQQTFGNKEALAWAFAAGMIVSAASGASENDSRARGILVKTLNASLLTWRLFGRPGLDDAQSAIAGTAEVPPAAE